MGNPGFRKSCKIGVQVGPPLKSNPSLVRVRRKDHEQKPKDFESTWIA